MRILAIVATAILGTTMPALAQYQHNPHQGPPPRRMAMHQRYHEGQNWRGHRLTNRNGHWGYYQPHNGVNLFVSIPL
jgi:hypothetical protein